MFSFGGASLVISSSLGRFIRMVHVMMSFRGSVGCCVMMSLGVH